MESNQNVGNWIPQWNGPDAQDLGCLQCDKPTQGTDQYCVDCALDAGFAPIGDRDGWE